MTLTWEEKIFVLVWIINLIVAVIYFLWGGIVVVSARSRGRRREVEFLHDNRRTYLIRFIVMILCPVIGPLFFCLSYLLYHTVMRSQVDLEDVIFSKDRVRVQLRADEDRERNIVPIEEAIAVSEKKELRLAMMNMIKGEIRNSLSSVALALNTKDSESSHYAASVLSDELNEFRMNVQKLYRGIQEEEEGQSECEEMLLDYMDSILKQGVFSDLEQKKYVQMMAQTGERLYEKDASKLTQQRYEGICLRFLEIKEYADSEKWCLRLAQQYPDELCSYTCRLKLYFTVRKKEAFFFFFYALKRSDVIIDNETLDLIKVFS